MSLQGSSTRTQRVVPTEQRPNPPFHWLNVAGIALTPLLLTLCFAPFGQAWLAWFAFVPLLLVLAQTRSTVRSALTGFIAGLIFFTLNLWWLWTATIPGMIAAIVYQAAVWGFASAAMSTWMRPARNAQNRIASLFFVAGIWCAGEYLRSFGYLAFPWLLLGQSQSPCLVLCQIADITGVIGISFCVMSVNVLLALAWLHRRSRSALIIPTALTAALLIATAGYGLYRLHTTTLLPGPRVLVVQSNHPYLRGGTRTISREAAADWYLSTLQSLLKTESPTPALIVLPETALPPLNPEARQNLARSSVAALLDRTHAQLESLASAHQTSILTGGHYVGGWSIQGKTHTARDLRNSAFLYTPAGQSDLRYDKIQLVPFAETMPFQSTAPWLHYLLLKIAAASAEQADTPGDLAAHTTFSIDNHPFITPICFENIDPAFIASAVQSNDPAARKRADFIINLTNDGWFSPLEHAQHFQAILFRAIENRVPIARSSNTGISGFIDPLGRVGPILPANSQGSLAANLLLDPRQTFYTRHPDFFGLSCLLLTAISIALALRKNAGN
jgi:apolipoprotein N-acyltransferase